MTINADLQAYEITALLAEADVFQKSATVKARQSEGGELIHTVVGEAALLETSNTTKAGDWIIANPGGEEYIIPNETFTARYSATDTEGIYEAKGRIRAIKNPFGGAIEITAPWGESQFGDEDCLIAAVVDGWDSPIGDNRYIIEAEAFRTTYRFLAV